jgi:patatin-like phospholipase/acyl hydrolase
VSCSPIVEYILIDLEEDGGGVRGISSLYILKAIMQRVKGPDGKELKPCDCFDLIVGTSTGG